MDLLDELQQERDINAALTKQLNTALVRIRFLEAELAAALAKAIYATWGRKQEPTIFKGK